MSRANPLAAEDHIPRHDLIAHTERRIFVKQTGSVGSADVFDDEQVARIMAETHRGAKV